MNSVNKYYLGGFHLFIYFINDWIGCHDESYTLAPVALFCINKSFHVYAIGHFRITFGLFFKASPGAHLFI